MVAKWIGVGAAALLMTVASQGHAAVTVIGGGLAEACSKAALAGETDFKFQKGLLFFCKKLNLNLN